MQIAVIGATGVLGRELLPLLLNHGHRVRALARAPEKISDPRVETHAFDLLASADGARLATLLRDCDAVLHLATAIPRDVSAPNAWVANTRLRTEGTRQLLDAALAVGAQKYIQQSISMAYSDGGDNWLDENTALDDSPERAAITAPVRAMEAMVRAIPPPKLNWCILRGGSFVGPGTAQTDLVARLRAGEATVPGDGKNFVSLIHVRDMATAVGASLNAPPGSTFNIVADPIRYGDYADALARSIGAPVPPRDLSRACPPSWRCSHRAAREQLKWTPLQNILGG
jgi:nucleoside-diphosphate-sugar epimerase